MGCRVPASGTRVVYRDLPMPHTDGTQYFTYMFARTHRLDTHTGVTRRQASEWNHPLGDRVLVPSPRAVIWIMPARSVLNVLREVMTKRRRGEEEKGEETKGRATDLGQSRFALPSEFSHDLVHPGETERGPHGWPGLG